MEKGHICIRLPFNWQKVQATVNEWSQCTTSVVVVFWANFLILATPFVSFLSTLRKWLLARFVLGVN